MKCLPAAFILLTLAARQVAGLDITVSGTKNGVPVPASELTFSKFDGSLGLNPHRTIQSSKGFKVAAAVAANPTAMGNNCERP